MSLARQTISFLIVAIGVSAALAYTGAIWSLLDGAEFDAKQFIVGPIFLAPFYFAFVSVGGLLVGLPTLLILRRKGRAGDARWLVGAGLVAGAIVGAVLLSVILGPAAIWIAGGLGAVGGIFAAGLWFMLVERHLRHA